MGFKSSALMFIFLAMLGADPTKGQTSQSETKAASTEQVQRVHSNLHHSGLSGQIPEMLSQTAADIQLRAGGAPVMRIELDPANELGNVACESDLVVVGRTGQGVSHMTADKGFIYTDWSFAVESILKNNVKAPVQPGSQIVVTRPGGQLLINGRKVSAELEHFRSFGQDDDLLLYLRFIPQTRAYRMAEPDGFAFADSKTTGFGKRPLRPEFAGLDKDKMIDQVKAAVAASGANSHCGGNNQ